MRSELPEIPHSLCTAFMYWMFNGGHVGKVSKEGVLLKKGENVAKIYCDGKAHPSYKMNEYCVIRYELFLKQWLKYGVKFLNELNACADLKMKKAHSANYLKFAA